VAQEGLHFPLPDIRNGLLCADAGEGSLPRRPAVWPIDGVLLGSLAQRTIAVQSRLATPSGRAHVDHDPRSSVMDILADRRWARALLTGSFVVVLCLATGAGVARYPLTYPLALVGLGATALLAWWNRGVLAGILVLLLLEGIPFIVTGAGTSRAQGSGALTDVVIVVLVAFTAACAYKAERNRAQDRVALFATAWASCFLAWWLYKVVAGSPGVPLLGAISYGREYAAFALFLPLALFGLRRREHLVGFALTLALAAGIFSVGQIATQLTHTSLPWLIHVIKVDQTQGVSRIFASMSELLLAAFPMAIAAMLIGPKAWRRPAMLLALLTGLANALSFTRAVYVSEFLGVSLISLVWASGAGWPSRRIRSAFLFGLLAIACAVVIGVPASASTTTSSSPVQTVIVRAATGVSNVKNKSGSTGVRLHELALELETLGDHWVAGLGFLNPLYRYFSNLPEGSIHNTDLGSLGIVMTLGVIGLLLAYMPPIAGLVFLLRRRRDFVQYGGAMYLTAALIASITLGTLASLPGLLVLGAMLVFCVNWTALDEPGGAP